MSEQEHIIDIYMRIVEMLETQGENILQDYVQKEVLPKVSTKIVDVRFTGCYDESGGYFITNPRVRLSPHTTYIRYDGTLHIANDEWITAGDLHYQSEPLYKDVHRVLSHIYGIEDAITKCMNGYEGDVTIKRFGKIVMPGLAPAEKMPLDTFLKQFG